MEADRNFNRRNAYEVLVGTGKRPPGRTEDPARPDDVRRGIADHGVLTGSDRDVVLARGDELRLYQFDDISSGAGQPKPITRARLAAPVQSLAARRGIARVAVVAALADQSLVEVDFPEPETGYEREGKPRVSTVVQDLGGSPRALLCTGRSTLVVVDERGVASPSRVSIDAANSRHSGAHDFPSPT